MAYGQSVERFYPVPAKQKAGRGHAMMPDNKAEMVDNQISVWSKRIGLVLLGWFASSAYHGTLSLNQKAATLQHIQTVELPKAEAAAKLVPKLKDVAGCQTARARIATQVAVQSEKGQSADLSDIPNCPLPPKVKLPVLPAK